MVWSSRWPRHRCSCCKTGKIPPRINLHSGNCKPLLPQVSEYIWLVTAWWRHQMETFSALLAICAGNSPVPGEFPTQRPVTRSFDVFFDLRLNKRLSKQSWGWWFETLSRPLWRHRNGPLHTCHPVTSPAPVDGKSTTQACKLETFIISRPPYFHTPRIPRSDVYKSDHVQKIQENMIRYTPWLIFKKNHSNYKDWHFIILGMETFAMHGNDS